MLSVGKSKAFPVAKSGVFISILDAVISPVNVESPVWLNGPILVKVPLPDTVSEPVIVWLPIKLFDPVMDKDKFVGPAPIDDWPKLDNEWIIFTINK